MAIKYIDIYFSHYLKYIKSDGNVVVEEIPLIHNIWTDSTKISAQKVWAFYAKLNPKALGYSWKFGIQRNQSSVDR